MCGIVGIFEINGGASELRAQALEQSRKIRHRGPDWSGIYEGTNALLAHERLAIVDPQSGKQPLFSTDEKKALAVNGEIYNHRELRAELKNEYYFKTESDCEIILALYQEEKHEFLNRLNGIFGFILYDETDQSYLIARDHMGVIPLYMGWDIKGHLYIASELKALEGYCKKIQEFPPGHYLTNETKEPVKWYDPKWKDYDFVANSKNSTIDELRDSFEKAVHRQLMTDVPYGVLLSGGLDSSIVSALAKKYASMRVESGDQEGAWWPSLHSFAIGLDGSPDLKAAKKVADHIGTIHHEVNFTIQEGLDALQDVIFHLETYDVTTIRASTPMYLLGRVIKSMGIKMVLSGEGSDEIFGGYLYFHKAPNDKEFHEETIRKLGKLHMYDCLRANKSLAAWGVEGRVPFLDKEFLDVAMMVNPKEKMITSERIEKWILREAFAEILPHEIAWRQKEQFSDGVGYGWIDALKDYTSIAVSDAQFEAAAYRFPVNTPQSKEEYFYRSIFHDHFESEAAAKCVPSVKSVACSTPEALLWDESFQNANDPSGRAVKNVHDYAYEEEKQST